MSPDGAELDSQSITLELIEALPEEIDVGADLTLAIRITSSPGLDLSHAPYLIMAAGAVRSSGALPGLAGEQAGIATIALTAPAEVGEHLWRFVIPAHERDGQPVEEASLPFCFRTRPHVTSLAVWDVPSPVVIGERFSVTVGAQCGAGCPSLQGREIEIVDEKEAVVARAALGAAPWPQTDALYWAAIALTTAGTVGRHVWKARLSSAQLPLPHGEASFAFSLITEGPPEHTVTVTLFEAQTEKPIADAQVRLGAHRMATDAAGVASFAVPGGEHELFVWKAGYEAPARTIEVRTNASLRIEAEALPVVNPDSYWQG